MWLETVEYFAEHIDSIKDILHAMDSVKMQSQLMA